MQLQHQRYFLYRLFPDTDWVGDADYVVPDNSELAEKVKEYFPYYDFVLDGDTLVDVVKTEQDISEIIQQKKSEVSADCEKAITAGVDVGDNHYSLTVEDQANILAWMPLAQAGQAVPYHADGQACRIYSAKEFMEVANAAVAYKTHHTTYCNLLMRQIEGMTVANDIKAVKYGVTELAGEYKEQYDVIMGSLVGGNDETT